MISDKEKLAVCSVNCECKTGEDCYGDAALNLFELEESGRNWQEDYAHENGNYLNQCMHCKLIFIGHKRRVACKLCSK